MECNFKYVEEGNFKDLKKLLDDGLNPNTSDGDGRTFLHIAALKNPETYLEWVNNLQIAQLIIDSRAKLDQKDNFGFAPLHYAVARSKYQFTEILLKAGATLDLKDEDGNTALHYAIHYCHLWRKILLELYCPNDNSCSDLRAVKQISKFPVSSSVINVCNNLKETPLMWAVEVGDLRVVQELLQNGAFPNLRDADGNTALHLAFSRPGVNENIVHALLRNGCFPFLMNAKNKTPIDLHLEKLQGFEKMGKKDKDKYSYMTKLFLLRVDFITGRIRSLLTCLSRLRLDIFHYRNEISKMESDKITPRKSVYEIVKDVYAYNKQLSSDGCDKLLIKLLTGNYPIYCDVIASCFPRSYLCHKFARICSYVAKKNIRTEFLTYDLRFAIANNYLSNFDMCNMMLAGK